MEGRKRKKYAAIASRHDAELLPFVVETCGGLGPDALAVLDLISGAASEHLSLWSREDVATDVLHSVAIAIQKANEDMRRIIRSSDNGSAAGPSGWTGSLLAALVEPDICRLSIIALLKDILNGSIPDAARPYLLASRLVAITKPNSDSLRPIAVGELFYRLAPVIVTSRTKALLRGCWLHISLESVCQAVPSASYTACSTR